MLRALFSTFALWLLALALAGGPACRAADVDQNARTLVHLLDYIAQDYNMAVENGAVISEDEYNEMQEFCRSAQALNIPFPRPEVDAEIQAQLKALQQLVLNKAAVTEVAAHARAVKKKVVEAANLKMAPTKWPNLVNARQLYAQNCVVCHGAEGKGDGSSGAALEPKPSNFHDQERMAQLSPFQAFNTISLGVQGTGMPGFSQLTEKEIWQLAFYVVSLRHEAGKPEPQDMRNLASLENVASLSDEALLPLLAGSDAEKAAKLAALRLRSEDEKDNSISVARSNLIAARDAYANGRAEEARSKALAAYLEGIEPIEPKLKALSHTALRDVERRMAAVRADIEGKKPAREIEASVAAAMETLSSVESLLQEKTFSPVAIFLMASVIILREGFEAVLVIVAILSILKAVKAPQAARWVHGGWAAALAVGGLAWIFSSKVAQMNGMQRESMEAIVSFVAVGVLLYLGFWLHNKTEIGRWKVFIECRVKAALAGGNLWGLFGIAFFAVFREAFETVLFLSALTLEGGSASQKAIGLGVASSLVAVFVMAFLLLRFSTRMPIRKLFGVSSTVMAVLAVILTGKGLRALQETGALSVTPAPFDFTVELLGFYPTVETILCQILVAALCLFLWAQGRKPSPQLQEVTSQT